MAGKLKRMSAAKKTLVGLGTFALFFGVIGALLGPPQTQPNRELVQTPAKAKAAELTESVPEVKTSKLETTTIKVSETLPFSTSTQNDNTLPAGQTKITMAGLNGLKIITYKVTYHNGAEVSREKISERVTQQPVTEIKRIGTKVAAKPPSGNCDPNYAGTCVPKNPVDVDCEGGNGPAIVVGPVIVIGIDIYGLDRDGNGRGCE
jgi:resuscitation-promoting factor RpfB